MSERDWQLPPSWQWARFDNVAVVASNLVNPADHPDAPHIAPNHIESGTGRLLPYQTIAEDEVTSPKHLFCGGQVLYSKIRPYLAKAALVDFAGLCSADMYPIDTRIDAAYLFRWMISQPFTARASRSQGRTVLPKINQKALAELSVPVAPVNEQRRIVAKIEALTDRSRRAKEALDAIPPLLERFRQSVLAAAFRGDLTADWRAENPDVEPASVLLERIRAERRRRWEEAELAKMCAKGKEPKNDKWKARYKEPEPVDTTGLPELPVGWCWAAAEELTVAGRSVMYGIIKPGPDTPGGVPYVRVTEMKTGVIDVATLKRCHPDRAAKFTRATLAPGDILISKDGTIGKVAIVPSDLAGGNITQHVMRLSPHSELDRRFVAHAIEGPSCQAWMTGETKGVALQGVNVGDFRKMPMPLAPVREQAAVVHVLSDLLRAVTTIADAASEGNHRHAALDQSILAKAFRGELVPQDPNDEPASVLLERIRAERAAAAASKPKRGRKKRRAPNAQQTENAEVMQRRIEAQTAGLRSLKHGAEQRPPSPSSDATTRSVAPATAFADQDPHEQSQAVYDALLGRGALDKDAAVRAAADQLRERGLADFTRLRHDGPLYTGVRKAIERGVRSALFDRPQRGQVRAVEPSARAYSRQRWRELLLQAIDGEPLERDAAVRATAELARETMGLDFKRLRSGGVIDSGVRSAINSAIRRGLLERVGPDKVRRSAPKVDVGTSG